MVENQKWNSDKYWCQSKNPKEYNMYEKYYIWIHAACSCKNGKYLGNFIDDSVITCD